MAEFNLAIIAGLYVLLISAGLQSLRFEKRKLGAKPSVSLAFSLMVTIIGNLKCLITFPKISIIRYVPG